MLYERLTPKFDSVLQGRRGAYRNAFEARGKQQYSFYIQNLWKRRYSEGSKRDLPS